MVDPLYEREMRMMEDKLQSSTEEGYKSLVRYCREYQGYYFKFLKVLVNDFLFARNCNQKLKTDFFFVFSYI